jgi:sulfatase modifying factor 1
LAALKEVETRKSQAKEKEKKVDSEEKESPKSNLFKYLLYLLVIIAAAAFILVNPLGIGKERISPEKQYNIYISSAERFKQAGEFEKAIAELEKAKKIKDTLETKKLTVEIQRNRMKKDFQALEGLLKGQAAKEEKLAACRDFLSKHKDTPANDETQLLVSQTNEFIAQFEKEISAEKIMEQEKQTREEYQKRMSTAVEHYKKRELEKAYESVKSAQELKNTQEAKDLEGKIIDGFISTVENYYKQANYPGARKSLDQAKKIIPGSNFQDLEQAIELLKEMPDHVQTVLKESKIPRTRIDRKNNWWQADLGDGIVMVYIPAGNFKKGDSIELTSLQDIYLDGYWLGKTEVSTAQYMKFADETGTNYPKGIETKGNDYPIVGISWDDAANYCRWLSGKTGLEFKLPSEAQWEKAARGTDGRNYPWGNQEPKIDRILANFLNTSGTDKVNSHPQGSSPYGLLNMSGNAAEWCGDVLTGREQGKRAARGGSFFDSGENIYCFSRKTWSPSERLNTVGFRVCLGTRKEGR